MYMPVYAVHLAQRIIGFTGMEVQGRSFSNACKNFIKSCLYQFKIE